MFNYFKYMITVPRKFILNWEIAGGVYLLILPLAFANSSVESLLIDTQREAFRGMSENETMMNLLGISDWDNVFTLEGMVTTYFLVPFVPDNELVKYSNAIKPPPKAQAIEDFPVNAPSANPSAP